MGVNAAGIMSKIESFENFLNTQVPTIFCVQETKLKRPNQIRTKSSKNYNFYELHRKSSSGGGLCIGVHKDIKSVWINQGDDEVECLIVEVWLNYFPVRIMTAYGPQLGDWNEKKIKVLAIY